MKVAVIGAGIIGVTTAFELAADGHEVTVFERRGAVAEETSFANAGVVAPGYVTPWAAPGMPAKVARFLLSRARAGARDAAAVARRHRAGCGSGTSACDLATYVANRARMQRLAFYSRTRLHEITEHFAARIRPQPAATWCCCAARRTASWCSPACRCCATPAWRSRRSTPTRRARSSRRSTPTPHFAGAIHLPDDEVGNCRQFAHAAARTKPRRCGVQFEFNTRGGAAGSGRAGARLRVWTLGDDAPVQRRFDAVVVCGGVDFGGAAAPAGPAHPAGGGLRLFDQRARSASRSTRRAARVMDERYKVAISRLGNRVRVAGSAEIGGVPEQEAAGRHPDALQGAARLVPRRGAARQHRRGRAGMERRAAHAARRPADDRRHRHPRRLDQPGPWLQRLGPVLRQRARGGGPDGRPRAGGRHRRPGRASGCCRLDRSPAR